MKLNALALLMAASSCYAQDWEAEIMIGIAGYQGDLTKRHFALRTLRPATNVNIKYNIGNVVVLRTGIVIGKVTGNDKYNKQADLKARNLNFQSNIFEANICAEVNLLEPDIFYAYPYAFAGVGIFHFNPFTHDANGDKVFLRPLSTEGQGLPDYPYKKKYSKTQFCIPFGVGWKVNVNKSWDLVYEIGYRALFTDYLDDVSGTYVDPQKLLAAKGPKAVELAYRAKPPFPQGEGDQRGNTGVKDWYFIHGIKLLYRFSNY